ncbi:MAG: hypothetical protein SWX82_17725 [Cyanobacteriota bacterium]|nr:hypothetical protein [Cyanobacteriota bacterium]
MKKYKLALIKQNVYGDLYVAKPFNKQPYKYSLKRSGPLGFFTAFETDFFIVNVDPSLECNTYKEKIYYCKHGTVEKHEKFKEKTINVEGKLLSQKDCSVNVDDIDFSIYDVVISIDIAIPTRILSKFPNILWCYYISEPCMPTYQQSLSKPLFCYDIFLNQMFRNSNDFQFLEQQLKGHIIDFPYCFMFPYIFHNLFGYAKRICKENEKLNIIIPNYVRKLLSDRQIAKIEESFQILTPGGCSDNFLKLLCQGDIYLRLGNKGKFGNETTEAVCAGAAFISTERGWRNRVYNIPGSTVRGLGFTEEQFNEALKLLNTLNENRENLEKIKTKQQQIAHYICYQRPLSMLMNFLSQKKDSNQVTNKKSFSDVLKS